MKLRCIYYLLAAFLYYLWIVLRCGFGRLSGYEFKREVLRWLELLFGGLSEEPPPL